MKFTIPGEPCGKARPRVVHNGNFSRAYTPEKTVNYETLVKLEYQRQCGDAYISAGGIHMSIIARCAIPNSASKRKAQAMLDGTIRPTKKPDCDNIIKIICMRSTALPTRMMRRSYPFLSKSDTLLCPEWKSLCRRCAADEAIRDSQCSQAQRGHSLDERPGRSP